MARAAKVEKQANHELERLIPLLNLNKEQQDLVFDRLAQNSADWHPALQLSPAGFAGGFVVGDNKPTPAPAPTSTATPNVPSTSAPETATVPDVVPTPTQAIEDIIAPILTDDQETALQQDLMDRQEWWDEMIQVMKTNMEEPPVPQDKEGTEGNETLAD